MPAGAHLQITTSKKTHQLLRASLLRLPLLSLPVLSCTILLSIRTLRGSGGCTIGGSICLLWILCVELRICGAFMGV